MNSDRHCMDDFNWKEKFSDLIEDAREALKLAQAGNTIFIGTGCGQPQYLVNALVNEANHVYDAHIVHLMTMGSIPYFSEDFQKKFHMNSYFIAKHVTDAFDRGVGDYTPIFLSEIPHQFESGRIPIDVALITVTPPDMNGLCSLGISVDIVKSAAANAKCVIAQVNENMPRTFGNSFIHVNAIDVLVPHNEPMLTTDPPKPDETLSKIGYNLARLVENGSTIECGIGRIAQALAECLHDKKDLGIHTEMFGDWIIELIESGAVTCSKKTINHGKVIASFCMGSQRLYDYVNNNTFFEFHPTEYVNNPFIISKHDKMVGINVAHEIDLTGQVCSDSLGERYYRGVGGQVDFMRGCARSRGGKPIIALPSTSEDGAVSRIVPKLSDGAGVVTTRGDVHYVVTEYGIAYLHGKNIRQRALSLINIAHPKFRTELLQAAKAQKYIDEDQIEIAWDQVRYPEELEQYDTLHDGTEIFFRPVKPTDEPALTEMLYSLSIDSVEKRYFTHTKRFPHQDVQRLTNLDYNQDLAIVGVVPGPCGEDIVAIAQYFLDPKTANAEVAFIVQDEWQDKGMGTFLLNYITKIAIGQGVKGFYATVLPTNKAMLTLFYNSGYEVHTDFDGSSYTIRYDLKNKDT
ncbi:MAG: GNAT family N-acetyltransferase [bacterium]|nr:MAG: GNAT family N-acetyltransferase [bacterium]